MTEYQVEYAKSGRSSCKSCRDKIEKKAIRVGVSVERNVRGNMILMTSWFHLKCFGVPPNFGDWDSGFDSLSTGDQRTVRNYVNNNSNSIIQKKTKAIGSLSDEQQKTEKKLQSLIEYLQNNFTGKRMEAMLRLNNQKISGKKNEKAYRCADGVLFGRLPTCPKCGGGKLRNTGNRQLTCPGYRDDEDYHRCFFRFNEYNPGIGKDDDHYVERGKWQYCDNDDESEINEFLEDDKDSKNVVSPPPTPFSGEEADDEVEESQEDDDDVIIVRQTTRRKKKRVRKKKKKPAVTTYSEDEEDEADESSGFYGKDEKSGPPRRSTRLARKERIAYSEGEEESESYFDDTQTIGKKRKRTEEDDEYVPPQKKMKLSGEN